MILFVKCMLVNRGLVEVSDSKRDVSERESRCLLSPLMFGSNRQTGLEPGSGDEGCRNGSGVFSVPGSSLPSTRNSVVNTLGPFLISTSRPSFPDVLRCFCVASRVLSHCRGLFRLGVPVPFPSDASPEREDRKNDVLVSTHPHPPRIVDLPRSMETKENLRS